MLATLGIFPDSSTPFDPSVLSPIEKDVLIAEGVAATAAINSLGLLGALNELFGRGTKRRHHWLMSRDLQR